MPTITALHAHHDRLRAIELERARRLLAGGTPPEEVLKRLARGLTNKFVHAPTQALNQAGAAQREELLSLLHHVYQLPEPTHSGREPGPTRGCDPTRSDCQPGG